MELTKENKRWILIIGAIIAILFVVGLMLKFWIQTIIALAAFGVGFYYGWRSAKGGKDEGKDDKKGLF
ncbi:MAG: hypothetical protein ACPG21_00015 [Crocinitomicaceae bacterium]